jgi:hypothetical protein
MEVRTPPPFGAKVRLDLGNVLLLGRMSMPHSSQQFTVVPCVAGVTAVLVVKIPSTQMSMDAHN